jgi:hypothetical protein
MKAPMGFIEIDGVYYNINTIERVNDVIGERNTSFIICSHNVADTGNCGYRVRMSVEEVMALIAEAQL